ncbi:TIGR02217 family protein [Halodurantibacterium flavum]|uniref:TIGR02217 family protein n=1 Tax=Halodurantibacterium flavum TaxID=1382802 RepID=A0ABW4S3H4_9RHOB
MAFHEVRFPDNISRGARGGPERRTQIVELASGAEERNASWADSRRRYDVSYGIRRADDLAAVVAFFEARNGRLYGFRFKDWADYRSGPPSRVPKAQDQLLGTGNGIQRHFRLRKLYGSETTGGWWRAIRKPVAGSVRVALGEIERFDGWTLDAGSGTLIFAAAPEPGIEVRAGFEFDVPVRFDSDLLQVTLDVERLGSIPSIQLIELRERDAPLPL